jgi:hypothetical protein
MVTPEYGWRRFYNWILKGLFMWKFLIKHCYFFTRVAPRNRRTRFVKLGIRLEEQNRLCGSFPFIIYFFR